MKPHWQWKENLTVLRIRQKGKRNGFKSTWKMSPKKVFEIPLEITRKPNTLQYAAQSHINHWYKETRKSVKNQTVSEKPETLAKNQWFRKVLGNIDKLEHFIETWKMKTKSTEFKTFLQNMFKSNGFGKSWEMTPNWTLQKILPNKFRIKSKKNIEIQSGILNFI